MSRRVFRSFFIILSLATFTAAQGTTLRGTVSDENGDAISNVRVIVVDLKKKENVSLTDGNGLYSIFLTSNVALLRFTGAKGFRDVHIRYCPSFKKELKLDVVMDVDLDGEGVMYSEIVCDTDGDDCRYFSQRGKGTTEPKLMTLNCPQKRP